MSQYVEQLGLEESEEPDEEGPDLYHYVSIDVSETADEDAEPEG